MADRKHIAPRPEKTVTCSSRSTIPSGYAKASGIELEQRMDEDIYLGKPDALIAAGLLVAEQVPGWPGMRPASAIFVEGVLQPLHSRRPHDEHWMQVTRMGSKLRLTKGIDADEKRRRAAARQAEIDKQEREKQEQPKSDIGFDAARTSLCEASALFKVGDQVWVNGSPVVVTGGYMLSKACCKDGEFLDKDGTRFNYQYGYLYQYRNGEQFFNRAGKLTDEHGNQTHLRLVRGAYRSQSQ